MIVTMFISIAMVMMRFAMTMLIRMAIMMWVLVVVLLMVHSVMVSALFSICCIDRLLLNARDLRWCVVM